MAHVLVVDDDPMQREILGTLLHSEGYEVRAVERAADAMAEVSWADVVLLDVMMPEVSGFEALAWIKQQNPELPIIMLTALDEVDQRVRGLEEGALDYVAKPFNQRELLARIKAVLKKAGWSEHVSRGPISIDPFSRQVWVNQQEVRLSRLQFDLLWLLLRYPQRVWPREQLMAYAWGDETLELGERAVDVRVAVLREKLRSVLGYSPIESVRGVGYRYAPKGS